MVVVIANKYSNQIKSLGLPIVGLLEGSYTDDEIIAAFSNFYYEKLVFDITSLKNYNNISVLMVYLRKIFTFLDSKKTVLLLENTLNNQPALLQLNSLNLLGYTFDITQIPEILNNNQNFSIVSPVEEVFESVPQTNNKSKIIGIKNVTEHAGATTLIYMLHQELSKHYSVKSFEINKEDFKYFSNEQLKSISGTDLIDNILIEPFPDVILVDINDYENDLLIKDIVYLIEPSMLKLNKLVQSGSNILQTLKNKKVVLNRTNISTEGVDQFEKETEIKIFDVLRNVDEKNTYNSNIINLLIKLGFNKINNGNIIQDDTEKKKMLFDIFK